LFRSAGAMREDTWGWKKRRGGGARWARTVGIVAPTYVVAQPQLPIDVVAPALDGRVILQREAGEGHRPLQD
jgi:hypothetical protein